MDFESEREAALYSTLKQLLQNHVTSHTIAYQETRAACMSVLGYVLYVMCDTPEETAGLVESTIGELYPRLRQRAEQGSLPLSPFHDYAPLTVMSDQAHDLGTALATYLATSGIEYNMSVVATWRAYLALVADILVMPLHAGVQSLAEVEADIMALRGRLPAVMQMWGEAAADGEQEDNEEA